MTSPDPPGRPASPVIAIDGIRASLHHHEFPGSPRGIPPPRFTTGVNNNSPIQQNPAAPDKDQAELDRAKATRGGAVECSTGKADVETRVLAARETADDNRIRVRKQSDLPEGSDNQKVNRAKRKRPSGPYTPWEISYGLLVEYKKKNGHTRVPRNYVDGLSGRKLGVWVADQRSFFSKKQRGLQCCLSEHRIKMLNKLDFEWTLDTPWETWFGLLVDYKKKHGHTRVPQRYSDEVTGRKLGHWVASQRSLFTMRKNGLSLRLTDDRIARLNGIEFEWTTDARTAN